MTAASATRPTTSTTVVVATGILFAAAQLAVYATTIGREATDFAATTVYRAACVLLLAGFVGLIFAAVALHARMAGRAGALGTAGLVGAVTGTVLMAGDWWYETFAVSFYAEVAPQVLDVKGAGWLAAGGLVSYVVFALGWALVGIAALRAGTFSRWAGIALIVGGIAGFGAVLPPYGFALGAAVAWAGLAARTVRTGRQVLDPAVS